MVRVKAIQVCRDQLKENFDYRAKESEFYSVRVKSLKLFDK